MSAAKKATKGKSFTDEVRDYINKRSHDEEFGEDEISRMISQFTSIKKKKNEVIVQSTGASRQKILDLVGNQIKERDQCNENLLKSLSEIISQTEAEYNAKKENEKKLEHLTVSYMKCIQQSTKAYGEKLGALKEIYDLSKIRCEDLENAHKAGAEKVVAELENDIKQLQNKAISEGKRNSLECISRTIYQVMNKED